MITRLKKRSLKTIDWLRGWLLASIALPFHKAFKLPLWDVSVFQRRIPIIERHEFSQNGEDGIVHAIFGMIGTTNKYYVEFGTEEGIETNTHYLLHYKGWRGLLMDGGHENHSINLFQEFITAENIEALFKKYNVPPAFDLLSIDIDGNDYWVWKAITNYKPRVVIIEYNACLPYAPAVTIPYDAKFMWDKTDYYGASLSALVSLGKEKGYTLICTDKNGVNAFFVLDELVSGHFHARAPETLYRPAAFKGKAGNAHPRDPKARLWTQV